MSKYNTLCKILDRICADAPAGFKSYKPKSEQIDKVNQARSRAFIHLFLKVKCGIDNFENQHKCITDDPQDGGLDAFYIDRGKKRLFLIQSKFRITKSNFETKTINADDLVKMEIKRILKGETKDSRERAFNDKIKSFQKQWFEVSDQAHYHYVVVILGNLKNYTDEQIKRLVDNADYEVYDFERTYNELVFPLCTGTCYDPKEIRIKINLFEKEQSTLKQKITTSYGDFQVRVIFVPALEVGKILSQYKNSMLLFNPRNYLSLARNKVNQKIRDSILNIQNNDFAILNNGITIIAESFEISELTGKIDVGQVIMSSPQIINGGQTAYTLSKIYEDYQDKESDLEKIFKGKEVMLKVVIVSKDVALSIRFIEAISDATNQQTRVEEADRRSNSEIQMQIQKKIFDNFGYFYERKSGEFYYGLESDYINDRFVVDRDEFLRAYLALKGKSSDARRASRDTLFKEKSFKSIFNNINDYKRMLFAYLILDYLNAVEKRTNGKRWGYGLRYGKMSIVSAAYLQRSRVEINRDNINQLAEKSVKLVKKKWMKFEKMVKKRRENKDYFINNEFDYDNYYKGKTVNSDIKMFFGKIE